jgi:hypothetical protein
MVKVRKTKAREEFGPDPSLDLPQGAHLKVMNAKLFPPKFHEETGDLWKSKVSLKLKVVDDRTEDGDADDLEFFDGYDLKFDEDVAKKFGIGPEEGAKDNDGKKLTLDKFLDNANKRDFTEQQQAALLEEANWTVRTGTKLDNLLSVLYGEAWINGQMNFDPDDLEGKEFIAKIHPKTGKKPGSYTGWNTYMSLNPPKKKKSKLQEAQEEAADAADTPTSEQAAQDLTEAEWAQAKEDLRLLSWSSASAPTAGGVRTLVGGRPLSPGPLLMREVPHLPMYTTRASHSMATTGPSPMWTACIWPKTWSG